MGTGILLLLGLASLAVMAVVVIGARRRTVKLDVYGDSGLNLNVDPEREPAALPPAGLPRTAPGADRVYRSGVEPRAPAAAGSRAVISWTAAVRSNESRYERLARRYSAAHPVIRQYGVDWMRYPDLHRFNDEYFRDHDPIRFARNVAASPNFARLVKKYAHRPEVIGFCRDAAMEAPPELLRTVQDYLRTDSNAAELLRRFTTAAGLPEFLLSGLLGGAGNSGKAVLSAVKSNPQLQEILQRENIDPDRIDPRFRR